MDSLSATHWDVLISGTGLQQSLLALALSRSGKRVLHVDRNDYYGGADAALSLQEAESWVEAVNGGTGSLYRSFTLAKQNTASSPGPFQAASVVTQSRDGASDSSDNPSSRLSFSRAYTLSLSPQLIYTRSDLLPKLVSSKLYRQLEFQAVGSWWIYEPPGTASSLTESKSDQPEQEKGRLKRVPNGREDVFADKNIDLRAKRSLMKLLRFVGDFERQQDGWGEWAEKPFPDFLRAHFDLPWELHAPVLALTLSPWSPKKTLTSFALPRIKRHLSSIGVFGPGFAAVIPKWGGGAEIAQVACRACAVGGGVYVLGKGVESIGSPNNLPSDQVDGHLSISLQGGETVDATWAIISQDDLPTAHTAHNYESMTRSITVVSSALGSLFPVTAEGAPSPGGAVVVFPTGTLSHKGNVGEEVAPVYIIAHSSETGECPDGQCVLYASTSNTGEDCYALLDAAVEALLQSLDGHVLWCLRYTQRSHEESEKSSHVVAFPPPSLDLAFDDEVLRRVEDVWKMVDGDGKFMQFEERGGLGDDEE